MKRETMRERMVRTIELTIAWNRADQYGRDYARREARAVVDALFEAPAQGKAIERALHVIEEKAG